MIIRMIEEKDFPYWLSLRIQLWPECPVEEHHDEMKSWLKERDQYPVFAAFQNEQLIGFLEASVMTHANIHEIAPVFYVEGWFVDRDFRKQRVATKLMAFAEAYGKKKGYETIFSDTEIFNKPSARIHQRMGFIEVNRTDTELFFKKILS